MKRNYFSLVLLFTSLICLAQSNSTARVHGLQLQGWDPWKIGAKTSNQDFQVCVNKAGSETCNLTLDGPTAFVGIGTAAPLTPLHAVVSDAVTAATSNVLQLNHLSSGTPAAAFGTGLLFTGKSTTTDGRSMSQIQAAWKTATDASRASLLQFQTLTGAGSLTTHMTLNDLGSVGIGTTAPASGPGFGRTLHIKDTDASIRLEGTAGSWEAGNSSANAFQLYNGTTLNAAITNAGAISLGVSGGTQNHRMDGYLGINMATSAIPLSIKSPAVGSDSFNIYDTASSNPILEVFQFNTGAGTSNGKLLLYNNSGSSRVAIGPAAASDNGAIQIKNSSNTLTVDIRSDTTSTFNNGVDAHGQIVGTTTNDAASTGNVGEFHRSTATGTAASSGTIYTVANTGTLTAGEWNISVLAALQGGSATVFTGTNTQIIGISDANNTLPDTADWYDFTFVKPVTNTPATSEFVGNVTMADFQVKIANATTATYYANAKNTYTGGAPSTAATIIARRIR